MEKTKLVYRIAEGYHVRVEDGKALIQVLTKTFSSKRPTPDELIAEARKKNSPIHGLFEWDVKKAARTHWRDQALYYLRAVEVVRLSVKTGVIVGGPVRLSVPVEYSSHRVERYVPAQCLGDNPTDVAVVLDRVRMEFRSWLARYRGYTGFLEMFDPVIKSFEEVERKLERMRPRRKRRKAS